MSAKVEGSEGVDSGAVPKTPTTVKAKARKIVKATPIAESANKENEENSNISSSIPTAASLPNTTEDVPPAPPSSSRKSKDPSAKLSARKSKEPLAKPIASPPPVDEDPVVDNFPACPRAVSDECDLLQKTDRTKKPVEEQSPTSVRSSKSKSEGKKTDRSNSKTGPPQPEATNPPADNKGNESFEFIQKAFSADPTHFLISQAEMETAFPKMGTGATAGCLVVPEQSTVPANVLNQSVEGVEDAEKAPTPDEVMLKAGFLGQTELLQVALMRGASLTYKDETGRNVIHYVTATKSLSLLKRILRGMNRSKEDQPIDSNKISSANKFRECINGADNRGWTPLLLAVCKGYAQVVELLASYPECDLNVRLSHSCLPNKGDPAQSSAMHFAAVRGDLEVAEKLLMSPHAGALGLLGNRDSKDRIPAHYATASDKTPVEFLKMLFSSPTGNATDILAVDVDGHTPFGNAVSCGRLQHLEFLSRNILGPLINQVESDINNNNNDENSKSDSESLTIPTKNLSSSKNSLTFSSVLFAKDSNGLNCLQLAYLRGHSETLFSLSRLWKFVRHPTLDPLTLSQAILQSQTDISTDQTFDDGMSETDKLVEILAMGVAANSVSDLDALEKSVFSTAATVLGEDSDQVQGQLARTVKKLGAEYCLMKIDETMKIEKSGGRLTADGKRRKTPGGVFYQLIKEDLQSKMKEAEFRALWRFITTEQNEKQKAKKKQNNQKQRQPSNASSTSSHLHSVPVAVPPPPSASAAPAGQSANNRNLAPAGRTLNTRAAGQPATRGSSPPVARGVARAPSPQTATQGSPGGLKPAASGGRAMPSFAAPTAQYANSYHAPQGAAASLDVRGTTATRSASRDGGVLKGGAIVSQSSYGSGAGSMKRFEGSKSPDGPRRFAANTQATVLQSRSGERMAGQRSAGSFQGSAPRFAAMTEAAQGRMAPGGHAAPPPAGRVGSPSRTMPEQKQPLAQGRRSPPQQAAVKRNVNSQQQGRPNPANAKPSPRKDIAYDDDEDDEDNGDDNDGGMEEEDVRPCGASADRADEDSREVDEDSKSAPMDALDDDDDDYEEDCLGNDSFETS